MENNHIHICSCSVPKSYLTLCDPVDYSLPGSSVHGIFLARILEWVVMPSSNSHALPNPEFEPASPALALHTHVYMCVHLCVCVSLYDIYIIYIYTHIYSTWGYKKLDTIEVAEQTYTYIYIYMHIHIYIYITELLCIQYYKSIILQLKKLSYACLAMTPPFTVLCLQ